MRLTALALCVGLCSAGQVSAATHAIVIGIDKYAFHPNLQGAVNDSVDLSGALKTRIDGQMTVLIDAQANRENFDRAWSDVLEGARDGDTLIFSFSGHGVTAVDDDAYRDEADGLDELLVLQPAIPDATGLDAKEYVRDDELFQLFRQAEEKGIRVVFVADACHSGGLSRQVLSPEISEAGLPFRLTQFSTRPSKPAINDAGFKPKPEVSENVIFISATNERRKLQELLIDGKAHGALSYYTARAFEGRADKDDDGLLTGEELKNYVIPMVVAAAADRQIPEFTGSELARGILLVPRTGPVKAQSELPQVSVFIDPPMETGLQIDGMRIASSISAADLVFRAPGKTLHNSAGDQLAEDLPLSGLGQAVASMRLRSWLHKLAEAGNPLSIGIDPDDRLYGPGCAVRLIANSNKYRHFTAFNLTATGRIQLLFPLADFADPLLWESSEPWSIKSKVTEPFGADFLVFIASRTPLTELHALFKANGSPTDPIAFFNSMSLALGDNEYEIGLKGAYTARTADPC